MASSCEASGATLFVNQPSHQLQALPTDLSNENKCGFTLMEDNMVATRPNNKSKNGDNVETGRVSVVNHGIDNASSSSHSLVEDFVLHPKEQNMPSFWIPPLDSIQGVSVSVAQNSKYDAVKSTFAESGNSHDCVQTVGKPAHPPRQQSLYGTPEGKDTFVKPTISSSGSLSTTSRSSLNDKQRKIGEPSLAVALEQPIASGINDFKGGGELVNNDLQKSHSKVGRLQQSSHQTASSASSVAVAEFGGQYRMSLARKAMSVWMKRHNQRTDNSYRQASSHQTTYDDQTALETQAAQDGSFILSSYGEENYYPLKSVMSTNLPSMDGVIDMPMSFQQQNLTFQSADLPNVKTFDVQNEANANHVSSTNSSVAKKKKWKRPLTSGLKANKPAPLPLPTVTHASGTPQANVTEWNGVMKWLGWYKEKVEEYKQAGEEMPLCKRVYRDKIGLATSDAPENQKKKKSKKKRPDRRQEHAVRTDSMQHDLSSNTLQISSVVGNKSMTLSTLCNGVDGKPVVAARATVNGNSYLTAQANTKLAGNYVGTSNVTSRTASSATMQQLTKVATGLTDTDNLPSSIANNNSAIKVTNGVKDRTFVKAAVIDNSAYTNHNDSQIYYSLGNFPVGGVSSADVREAANADNLVPTVPSDDVSKGYSSTDLGLLASIQGAGTIDGGDHVITPTSHKACPLDTMDLSWDGCLPSPPVQLNTFSTDLFQGRSAELSSDITSFVSFDSPFHLLLEAASLPRANQQAIPSSLPSFTRTFAASNHVSEGNNCPVNLLDVHSNDESQFYEKVLTNNNSVRLLRFGIDTPAPIMSYVVDKCVVEEESKLWYDLPPAQPTSLSDDVNNAVDVTLELETSDVEVNKNVMNAANFPSMSDIGASNYSADATNEELPQWQEQNDGREHSFVDDTVKDKCDLVKDTISFNSTNECIVRHNSSITTNTISVGWIDTKVLVTGPYSRWK